NITTRTVYFIVSTVGCHGNYNTTCNTLQTASNHSQNQQSHTKEVPALEVVTGQGKGSGVTKCPQQNPQGIANQSTPRANQHGLSLAQKGNNNTYTKHQQ